MKRYFLFRSQFLILFCILGIVSCSDDNSQLVEPNISIDENSKSILVDWNEIESSIRFTTNASWTVAVSDGAGESVSWMQLAKTTGEAGTISLPVLFVEPNDYEVIRSAVVTVSSGMVSTSLTITQAANPDAVLTKSESDIPDFGKYYKPGEFAKMNMLRSDAKWSWFRAAQSEHFVVFWEPGFGENPNSSDLPAGLRVDIADLLDKAEQFYHTNVETLKFAEVGVGKSYLDKYKMQIYLIYQTEWLATGAGYDNVIGALWVNPSTCQPVGSTIAHEIGHSFQYQVYCDKLYRGEPNNLQQGFRYGHGPNGEGGSSLWEQCAQWQSFIDYPGEIFGHHWSVFQANSHRHFSHEWMRYASYWLQYYWAEKHGIEVVGNIWRESYYPEDALMTYTRLYGGGQLENMYDDLYNYATRMVTYDMEAIAPYAPSQLGGWNTQLYDAEENYYQVAYASCLGTSGFNIIPLNVPQVAGATVAVNFVGLSEGSELAQHDPGSIVNGDGVAVSTTRNYNTTGNNSGEWRYGFVAVVNGKATYGEMGKGTEGRLTYDLPEGASHLFLVVVGTPTDYRTHWWNDDESDDAQWPYKVKFEGTDLLGSFEIDNSASPKNLTLTYPITCSSESAGYDLGAIDLQANEDIKALAQAFVMKPAVLTGSTLGIAAGVEPIEGKIAFGLLQPDGVVSYNYTANSGFYCTADGYQGSWGNNDPIWIEYNKENFVLTYGHRPGATTAGQKYIVKPALVYLKDGIVYTATFVLELQF